MKYGTKFLRNTYQNVVRIDETNDLEKINPKDINIVYGEKDTAVDPYGLLNKVDKKYINSINIIENANHDNIITDYIKELKIFLDKNK